MLSPTPRPSRAAGYTVLAVALTALALGTAAWLFVRYPGVLVSGVANTDPKGHVDFETFWRSTVALLHGADTYQTGSVLPNLNPPFLSLLLAPFGLLAMLPSYWAFSALTVLLVTAAVLLTARELRLGRGATVFAVLTMWASSPLHGTLLLGQIYGLLLFGLVLAWLAQRRGREVLAAVLLGVVVALKPSLAPLLLIPLAQRRWPALWAGIASAGVTSVAGVLAAGPSSALEWLRLATHTPAPEVDANASLPGLVARLGGPGQVGWLLTVAVVLGSLWWIRRAPASPGGLPPGVVERADATIFAVAAGCLVAAPIAWLNYTVMLWPGALVLLRAGRWRVAVPLLVFPVIPVAWGNLWQAAPTATVSLVGRSLYCAVLLGFWIALLEFARNYPASPFAAPVEGAVAAPATGSDPAGREATVESGAAEPGAAGSAAARSTAAGSAAARSGTAGAAGAGSPRSQSTPLGGIRSDAEAGRPCQGSSVATTEPRFPTPEPP
ncbi:MAG: arabinofuranan 3-O-arabinosyltransferase [Pseudonocardiales bacterium]|nr:arabinofuranan 3-O-arabinosyltransferase [Pseudonocardiales bacterium]